MTTNTNLFAPEVTDYMLLNGYKLIDNNNDLGLLSFKKDDVAVVFYQDRIERRIISPDKNAVTRNLRSFKGFDGKDVFDLMMILHLIKAVDLRLVKREVYKQVGIDKSLNIAEIITALV